MILKNLVLFLLKCLINLKTRNFFWFINNFKIDKVLIGDLIADTYINSNSNFKSKIDFLFMILFSAIFKTILN